MSVTQEITHTDLVLLTAFLAQQGYEARTVAEAVEKPHKWIPELRIARAVLEHEAAHPDHTCRPSVGGGGDVDWYCDSGVPAAGPCDWTFTCTCPASFNPSGDCVIHGGL